MGKRVAFIVGLGVISAVQVLGCGREEQRPKSEIILEGSYVMEGAENISFTFSDDSTLQVKQSGVYAFSTNEEGDDLLRICFADTSRELPEDYSYTDYIIEKRGRRVYLTFTSEQALQDQQPMILSLLGGTDGIPKGEPFSGIYQIGSDGDSYQFVFEKDGTVYMQIDEYYNAREERITLSDDSGSTDYKYDKTEDMMQIQNLQGETIISLRKAE